MVKLCYSLKTQGRDIGELERESGAVERMELSFIVVI